MNKRVEKFINNSILHKSRFFIRNKHFILEYLQDFIQFFRGKDIGIAYL